MEVHIGRRLGPGEVARHKVCDNRVCCNGAHLRPGTIADNNRDMVEHGRVARGDRSGSAKLTDEQVAAIQALGPSPAWGAFSAFARKFGVSVRQVSYIAKGERRRAA